MKNYGQLIHDIEAGVTALVDQDLRDNIKNYTASRITLRKQALLSSGLTEAQANKVIQNWKNSKFRTFLEAKGAYIPKGKDGKSNLQAIEIPASRYNRKLASEITNFLLQDVDMSVGQYGPSKVNLTHPEQKETSSYSASMATLELNKAIEQKDPELKRLLDKALNNSLIVNSLHDMRQGREELTIRVSTKRLPDANEAKAKYIRSVADTYVDTLKKYFKKNPDKLSEGVLNGVHKTVLSSLTNKKLEPKKVLKKTISAHKRINPKTKVEEYRLVPREGGKFISGGLSTIINIINLELQDQIRRNMAPSGAPSSPNYLRYQTGRFASSAEVTRMNMSKTGKSVNVYYQYQNDPYAVFDPKTSSSSMASKGRDPNRYIGMSIRDILKRNLLRNAKAGNSLGLRIITKEDR